ncbi:tropomyosin [Xenorhabdus szentirmaii]|uniref:phage tail protein n=1 Tax=Xenorhabdus szentirmaii TaxID=290112 RepID=UPI0019B5B21E|nr:MULTISPECIES: phage tail protein [unclassified Xenorhabdus]MBD2791573.1 phage tail protein [Xenorhabdus sp. CUL]MBD2825611.1 phage tail protein [Xenorhabdus sp. 5]
MADDNLKNPVEVQATRIDATLLPANFSQPYFLYVVQQGTDLGNVANKANQAGDGAYDAQVKNDEQDKTLTDHEKRLMTAETQIASHEERLTKAEETLVNHEQRLTTAESSIASQGQRITVVENDVKGVKDDVGTIKGDYLSKSATVDQSLASPLNVTTSYSVGGVKVVGARVTGFTPMSGSAHKGAVNANQSWSAEEAYTRSTLQSLMNQVTLLAQRCKAHEDALRTHGLID